MRAALARMGMVKFGLGMGGATSPIPANAIRDRAASPIADRAGSIIVTRT